MYPDHFLDANILIGSRIKWDTQYNASTIYMQRTGLQRCTSYTVFKGSLGWFHKRRIAINSYLEFLLNHKYPKDSDKIIKKVKRLRRKYFKNLDESKAEILKTFAYKTTKYLEYEIRKVGVNGIQNYASCVRDVLKNAIKSLRQDVNVNLNAPIRMYTAPEILPYRSLRDALNNIINNGNDVRILLESYFIKNKEIGRNVSFVTTDKEDFLDNKIEIERHVSGIHIQAPDFK